MSYDLYFSRRNGGPIALEEFSSYFRGRPHWEMNDQQAWYSNEDTGVYFSFEITAESDPADDEAPPSAASFNLNYFRPPYFALEAAPELLAFTRHFDVTVHDPQVHGMGDGEYSEEGFFSGWNAGNRFGYRSIVNQAGADGNWHTVPESRLLEIWRWNVQRQELQDGLEEDVFVPKIMFFEVDGVTQSVVVWGDAIPILLPVVDLVLIPRDKLAPRSFFRRKADMTWMPWADLLPVLSEFPETMEPQRIRRLAYERPPEALADFIRKLPRRKASIRALANDQVVSAELMAEAVRDEPGEAIASEPSADQR